jgi:hypothetical protein
LTVNDSLADGTFSGTDTINIINSGKKKKVKKAKKAKKIGRI